MVRVLKTVKGEVIDELHNVYNVRVVYVGKGVYAYTWVGHYPGAGLAAAGEYYGPFASAAEALEAGLLGDGEEISVM